MITVPGDMDRRLPTNGLPHLRCENSARSLSKYKFISNNLATQNLNLLDKYFPFLHAVVCLALTPPYQ